MTICIQLGKIRQPLSVKEGITLMNSSIGGTHLGKNVAKFQMDCNLCKDDVLCGTVGLGWSYGFLQWNRHWIVTP